MKKISRKKQKNGSEESEERIPRIMGAQTVQDKSGEYRNENQKTSDLDSADCVAKICWIIVPAATLEEKKSVGSHVRNLCM